MKDEFGKFGPIGNYTLIFHELFSPVVYLLPRDLNNINATTTFSLMTTSLSAEIKLPMNRTYNRPKGFGFITFQNPNDAKVAKEELHDKDILGRTIRVDLSLPK